MISKAFTEGNGRGLKEESDKVLVSKENWIGSLNLPNIGRENGLPSIEGKWIRKLLVWPMGNTPIEFTDLTKHLFK